VDFILQGVQAKVQVLGLAPFRRGAVELAVRVNQPTGGLGFLVSRGILLRLQGIEEVATSVALANELAREDIFG
jgi:hypothetical protein